MSRWQTPWLRGALMAASEILRPLNVFESSVFEFYSNSILLISDWLTWPFRHSQTPVVGFQLPSFLSSVTIRTNWENFTAILGGVFALFLNVLQLWFWMLDSRSAAAAAPPPGPLLQTHPRPIELVQESVFSLWWLLKFEKPLFYTH